MRRFLFFVASLMMGATTIGSGLLLITGSPVDMLGVVAVQWVFTLVVAMALSAPFVLAPPGTIGVYSFTLPLPVALAVMVFRVVAWIGRMILTGLWNLVFLVWRPGRRPLAAPGMAGPPTPGAPATPPPTTAGGPAGAAPSWQADPTGRYLRRYWDGTRWTAHVANGSLTAIDPL